MLEKIGVRELQQNASAWLRRVERGESFEVTARGRPVALLVPTKQDDILGRLEAEGSLRRGAGNFLSLPPLAGDPDQPALSDLLRNIRAEER